MIPKTQLCSFSSFKITPLTNLTQVESDYTMPRPASAQTRNDIQMKMTVSKQLQSVEDPVEKLRLLCLGRGSTGILGLGRVFRRMDDNGSGDLSREEFIKGLDDSGMGPFLSDEDYGRLFEQFDADGSGAIKFDEFIRAIRVRNVCGF